MEGNFRLESRQLSPEQEAEELVRFLKEDPKWKRLDFYFSTNFNPIRTGVFLGQSWTGGG